MIHTKKGKHDQVIGFEVDGKLLHSDYKVLIPELESLIEKHGSIRCLVEITNMHGFQMRALWDEIKFDTKHCKDMERCAVVGDPSWHQWMTSFGKFMFRKADVKYFPSEESDAAWEWLEEGLDDSQIGTGAETCAATETTGCPSCQSCAHVDQ